MDKVDPSGMAVTYIAAEKGFKKAELAIGDSPDSPDMSATRDLTGWSNGNGVGLGRLPKFRIRSMILNLGIDFFSNYKTRKGEK